jgi:hypothetical protein
MRKTGCSKIMMRVICVCPESSWMLSITLPLWEAGAAVQPSPGNDHVPENSNLDLVSHEWNYGATRLSQKRNIIVALSSFPVVGCEIISDMSPLVLASSSVKGR